MRLFEEITEVVKKIRNYLQLLEKYLPENLSEDASVIALKIKSKKKKRK
jgi:hypothetical protein